MTAQATTATQTATAKTGRKTAAYRRTTAGARTVKRSIIQAEKPLLIKQFHPSISRPNKKT
jgi:hypothetical protein